MGLFTNNKSTDDYAKEGNKLFDEGEYLQAVSKNTKVLLP